MFEFRQHNVNDVEFFWPWPERRYAFGARQPVSCPLSQGSFDPGERTAHCRFQSGPTNTCGGSARVLALHHVASEESYLKSRKALVLQCRQPFEFSNHFWPYWKNDGELFNSPSLLLFFTKLLDSIVNWAQE